MIREELGEDTTFSDADEFEEACSKLDAPEEVKKSFIRKLDGLRTRSVLRQKME